MFSYYPKGVCSRQILIKIEENIIKEVRFIGGCSGNTQGIAKLAVGMNIDECISRLKGIQCRNNTSCPDQLAKALTEYKEKQNIQE